ncbi:MAG TPA: carboxymuconolactone decarboxylase family protein [Acidimicrobiales bacterium]|nr:carboxymuconolactone decarboxylase family protein [Acidimicrobiales bacterium]
MGEPRLPPLPLDSWGDQIIDALQVGRASLLNDQLRSALDARDTAGLAAVLPHAITTLLHHPKLAGRFLAFNGALLSDAALPERWRELMVLRVAWRTGSGYEWRQHVRMSTRFGISEDEIRAVAAGHGHWDRPEGDLLAAVDELLDGYAISEPTWQALASHLDRAQLVEVPFVVGAYAMLAMAYKSFAMQPDASLLASATTGIPNPEE